MKSGLAISAKKMELFVPRAKFLRHHIHRGTILPIGRAHVFVDKFSDEIINKTML